MNKLFLISILTMILLVSSVTALDTGYSWYNDVSNEWTWENNDYSADIGGVTMMPYGNVFLTTSGCRTGSSYCAEFDGNSDGLYSDILDIPIGANDKGTIIMWAYGDNFATGNNQILYQSCPSDSDYHQIFRVDQNPLFRPHTQITDLTYISVPTSNVWHTWVLTWDKISNEAYFYQDGVLSKSSNDLSSVTGVPNRATWFGAANPSSSIDGCTYEYGEQSLDGKIDDVVFIDNYLLSESEIQQYIDCETTGANCPIEIIPMISPTGYIELKNGELQLFTTNTEAPYSWLLDGVEVSTNSTYLADYGNIDAGVHTLSIEGDNVTLDIRAKGGSSLSIISDPVQENVIEEDVNCETKEPNAVQKFFRSITNFFGGLF